MKFRTKTIIGVALIEGLLLSFLGLSVIGHLERSNQESIQRRVETTARLLSASLRDAMIAYDLATIESVGEEILGTGELAYLVIQDGSRHVLSERGRVPVAGTPLDEDLWSVEDGIFDREMAVEVKGQRFGSIRFGVDVTPLQALLAKTRQWTFGIAALEMLLVALFSYMLGTYLTRQLLQLRNSTQAVAEGNLNQEVPVNGEDELAETAAAFNHMVGQLREAALARHDHETAMRQALTAAESANVAKSRFLATMSHELRTPMNGILGMAQIMKMSDLNQKERSDCLDTILASGQSLLRLVNDILDLSKIESGNFELDSAPCEIATLCREVVALHRPNAEGKGLQISFDSGSTAGHWYLADAHRLQQMLGNLVGNAIKFTDEGSIVVSVAEVSHIGGAARLRFSVQDNGIGIPEDKQGLLFKPFTQVDDSSTRRYGGTGLGLSIVRTLARMMGGEVGLSSQPGEGSCFWFEVVLPEQARQEMAVAASAPVVSLRGRVLVAEDDPINRRVIAQMLERLGLEAVMAEDGSSACTLSREAGPFDLVLMDLSMPVLDGLQATEKILADCRTEARPLPKIVAVTAHAYESDRQRCFEIGMVDFLTKPIEFQALQSILSAHLPTLALEDTSTAPAAASAEEAAQTLPPELLAIIEDILPLLAENRFEGIRRFEAFHGGLTPDFQRTLHPVIEALRKMDFATACQQLNAFVATQSA